MRYLSITVGLACAFLSANQSFADSISLKLLGANPTGTVHLTSAALPPQYSGANFYAGVLDWSDNGSNTANYFTYCVDIAAVINTGSSYTFDSQPVSQQSILNNASVIKGITNLWNLNHQWFIDTLVNPVVNATNNARAEALQIAIWDIIYNGADGTLTSTEGTVTGDPVKFSNDGLGMLTQALTLASTAFNASATSTPNDLQLLKTVTVNGQSQLFLGTPPPTPITAVPLPHASIAGLALLGVMAGTAGWRRRLTLD